MGWLVIVMLASMLSLLVGCVGGTPEPASVRPDPAQPGAPVLTDPVSAVRAYTEWVPYGYSVMNTDVAIGAMSAMEEVRVNSYLFRNLSEENRSIDSRVTDAEYRLVSQEETQAVVAGSEAWEYRYFRPDTLAYIGPRYEARYDVTYTLVIEPEKGWVVDRVEAVADGEVE